MRQRLTFDVVGMEDVSTVDAHASLPRERVAVLSAHIETSPADRPVTLLPASIRVNERLLKSERADARSFVRGVSETIDPSPS